MLASRGCWLNSFAALGLGGALPACKAIAHWTDLVTASVDCSSLVRAQPCSTPAIPIRRLLFWRGAWRGQLPCSPTVHVAEHMGLPAALGPVTGPLL